MGYSVRKGVIYSENGIPETPRWFSDSRLSFQLDEWGITQVDYCSPAQRSGNQTLFLQRLLHGFRVYIVQELRNYRPAYRNCRIWPYGLESEWEFRGTVFKLRIMAIEERIVLQLSTPPELPGDLKWKLEFYRDFALVPSDEQDSRYKPRGAVRRWREWLFDEPENMLVGGFAETPAAEPADESRQCVGITANFPLHFTSTPINTKYKLTSRETLVPGHDYAFVIAFAPTGEELARRWRTDNRSTAAGMRRQHERYERVAAAMPELVSPYPALNDYFSLLPMYHEACKVTDVAGALKAKTSEYWVWGWDGLTSNHATLYWGDAEFIADMLRFYEETADPQGGIAHAYRHDMSVIHVSAAPSQGMYISLLQQYYAMTGDLKTVRERYSFARTIFERIAALEVQHSGMCRGTSLYPDFRGLIGETGEDISSLNNTFFYCAARAMEYLAVLAGDADTAGKAEGIFRRFEKHYLPLFFDRERGYPVSSIDAVTLERRSMFHSTAIKWDNNYMRELLQDVHDRCLAFFENHIVSPGGLRPIPLWCDAFDQDANQLHAWWPVSGEYYMRLINAMNRRDLVEQWLDWVGYWSGKLTCPEGIPLYAESEEPELDRWNSLKGSWQAYSMRGWYQAIVHGVVGVDAEAGGLHVYPYLGAEMTLKGMHYRGRRLTIEMAGTGRYVKSVEINGRSVVGTHKLPADLLEEQGEIEVRVERTASNPHVRYIVHGYGCELRSYVCREDGIRANLLGAGTARLKVWSAARPCVTLDGKEVSTIYDERKREAILEIKCSATAQEIVIR